MCKCFACQLTPHKFLEIEFSNYRQTYFNFQISWTRRCDHAGFSFVADIWGVEVSLKIYDHRHWDYERDYWYA